MLGCPYPELIIPPTEELFVKITDGIMQVPSPHRLRFEPKPAAQQFQMTTLFRPHLADYLSINFRYKMLIAVGNSFIWVFIERASASDSSASL